MSNLNNTTEALLADLIIADQDNPLVRAGLKLSHLRLLVMIEDLGKVSSAASALNMTQPAASRMLTEMEAIVRSPLCRRATRGVVLTQFGVALAKRARKILLELREANRELSQLRSGSGGSIYIGAVTAPAMSLVVPAIKTAMERYPGFEINVQVETSNVLIRELMTARHDFIIARIPDDIEPTQFDVHEISIEKACLLVRKDHPLLKEEITTLSQLANYDWIFQPHGTLLRRAVEDLFVLNGVPLPTNVINTPSIVVTLAIAAQTNAIAPISYDMAEFVISQNSAMGDVQILPTPFAINVRPYSLITSKDRTLPPSAQLLYNLVRDQAKAHSNNHNVSLAPI